MDPSSQAQVHLGALEPFPNDLPQNITSPFLMGPSFSMAGITRFSLGWTDQSIESIPRPFSLAPAVYYEGLAFPLNSSLLSSWLPITQGVLLANAPTQSLLGPAQGQKAILLDEPLFEENKRTLSAYSGSWKESKIQLTTHQQAFSFDGFLQHGDGGEMGPVDSWAVNGGMNWGGNGPVHGEGGVLAAQWMGRGDWFAGFTKVKFDLADFQELVWKPYFQKADQDGVSVQNFGNELYYHLNVAGLVESQLAGGWNRLESNRGTFLNPQNRGFVQNADLVDVLGIANLLFAFREDFSDQIDPVTNFSIGLKGKLTDEWILNGDLQTAAWQAGMGDRTADLGFENLLDPKLSLDYGYVHQQIGPLVWDGFTIKARWKNGVLPLLYGRPISLEVGTEGLWDQLGDPLWDWSGKLLWEFIPGWGGWVGGRKTADQPWWTEIGVNIPWAEHLRSIIWVSNLNGLSPGSNDLYESPGLGVHAGLEGEF
jgi:hypothetical protein